jgi:excinuclease UvrABC helicase subunit UvrB
MVTIMTLLIICAVFAILGGLAFTEVRAMQFKLQEKQRQYDEAITALDVYRSRIQHHSKQIEFYRNSNTIAGELVGNMSAMETLQRERIEVLKTEVADYKQHSIVARELIDVQTAEVKALRVRVYALSKELQSIKETLPDWAGGYKDDEDDDLAPDDIHRS